MGQRIKQITIVGGGTAGWLSALLLSRYFKLLGGFKARLERIPAGDIAGGAVLKGELLARFAPPLTVDNFEGLAVARPIEAIGVEGNRDIVGFHLLGARAAQGRPRIGAGHSELQTGRQDFETEGIGNSESLEFVAGHGGNGHRNVLQTLVALLRGHHDFFECALRLRAACRSNSDEHGKRHRGTAERTLEVHSLSPEVPKK